MPSFTTINKVDGDGFICKYDTFKTREEADARIVELHQISGYEDAFVVDNDATAVNGEMCFQASTHFPVNKVNKTVAFNQTAKDATVLAAGMTALRNERESILVASDLDVLPDRWDAMDAATKTAWSIYRQALRDLPATTVDPANITWPTKPV